MRFLLGLALALFVAIPAQALVTPDCVTLLSTATINDNANGTITSITRYAKAVKFVASIAPVSGTTPTLDLKIQHCATSTGTCSDTPVSFTRCTTGTCYGGDNIEHIDLNSTSVHLLGYIRSVVTVGGTSPVYSGTVQVCTIK